MTCHFSAQLAATGFERAPASDKANALLTKVAFRIVRNTLCNVLIVADASSSKTLTRAHFESASRICARSLTLLRNANVSSSSSRRGGQAGGAIVLPSEYFGGHSGAYSTAGHAAIEQSSTANALFARPEMYLTPPPAAYTATGGARRSRSAGASAPACSLPELVARMARAYLRKEGRHDVVLGEDGIAALTQVVSSNIELILRHVRQANPRMRKVDKPALLDVVRSPEFEFLR